MPNVLDVGFELHPDRHNLEVNTSYSDEATYSGNCGRCGREVEHGYLYYDSYNEDEQNAEQYFWTTWAGTERIVLCDQCTIDTPRQRCAGECGSWMISGYDVRMVNSNGHPRSHYHMCHGCYTRHNYYECGECGCACVDRTAGQNLARESLCFQCGEEQGIEVVGKERLPMCKRTVSDLSIGQEPQRPFTRMFSFEMEMDGDYHPLLADMSEAGWCEPNVGSYHSSGHTQYPVHFEADSSVDVEMIVPFLDMQPRSPSLHVVKEVVEQVSKEVDKGNITFSMRTGCHVHVDAHNFHPSHMRNLYLIWCYLEDIMFRLGSVGYRCHRLAENNSHARPIDKSRLSDVIEKPPYWGTIMDGISSHSSGLNFANYNLNCRCGAHQMGMHEECTCSLGKHTIEFRVPNGTGNVNKVFAYLVLFGNMMNTAQFHPDAIKKLGRLEQFEYTQTAPQVEHRHRYKSRIKWMLKNLAYNQRERNAIIWCLRNCDLAANGILTPEFLDSLTELECELPEVQDNRTVYEAERVNRFPRLERI